LSFALPRLPSKPTKRPSLPVEIDWDRTINGTSVAIMKTLPTIAIAESSLDEPLEMPTLLAILALR